MRNLAIYFLTLAIASFAIAACSKDDEPAVILSAVSSLSVKCNDAAVGDTISLTTGQPARLEFSYAPKDAEIKEQEVTFASSSLVDSETETLTEGALCTVTASQAGATTVTYKVSYWNDSRHKDFSTIELRKVVVISGPEQTYKPVTSLSLKADDATVADTLFLTVGRSTALSISLPDGTCMKEVSLEPSDKDIFSASRKEDGSIVAQGIAGGVSSLTITVTYITKYQKEWSKDTSETGEYTITYPVRVLLDAAPVTDAYITVDGGRKDSLYVRSDIPLSLSVSYEPSDADVKNISLSVKDTSIASVSSEDVLSGKVSGSTELTITITYITPYGNEATFTKSVKVNVKGIIIFADKNVKKICIERWDTDEDGELSEDEALAVKDIGSWEGHTEIKSFEELAYFKNLEMIPDRAFVKCDYLTKVKIPESVKEIGDFAFFACQHLELEGDTFTLPESLEILGSDAFCFQYNTNIKKIVFKKNIKQINVHAFFTDDVTEIWFEGNEPPASYNITGEAEGPTIIKIGETKRTIKIYVPQNSLNKYNKKFKKLDGSEPQYVDGLDSTYLYKRTWNRSITSSDESTRYEIMYDKDDNIIHKINHLQRYDGSWEKIDGIKYIYATYMYPDKATSLMGRNSKYYEFIGY